MPVEEAVEGQAVIASNRGNTLPARARVLHGAPRAHLPVLAAAHRGRHERAVLSIAFIASRRRGRRVAGGLTRGLLPVHVGDYYAAAARTREFDVESARGRGSQRHLARVGASLTRRPH